jgi:tRNA A-37 threonylcarbamoyl transferase component Bud32
VMDYVECCGALDTQGYAQVVKAIGVLHDNNLVFGDLRSPNVLDLKSGAMLIDFDWCGEDEDDEINAF